MLYAIAHLTWWVRQRLYQALTAPAPPPGPPYVSPTHFASIRAGPGTARPLHATGDDGVPGITTFRVSTKDRTFVDEVSYKGWAIRLADWLHLSNPDDPSRPIVGHVFKCWLSDEPWVSGVADAWCGLMRCGQGEKGSTGTVDLLVLSTGAGKSPHASLPFFFSLDGRDDADVSPGTYPIHGQGSVQDEYVH